MDIMYRSTRGNEELVTASQAILKGLADDGGLYVPTAIPALPPLEELKGLDYKETAYQVLSRFLTDYTEEELRHCIEHAYDEKFDTPEIAPLKKVGGAYYLELFHGATIAFKDMALSILPHLLTTAARKNDYKGEIVILTATSGDTGKAALAGFANVPGTRIIVFYPKGGVSHIQELQMVTQEGDNTLVVGVKGNFDDCQTEVKRMFSDKTLGTALADKGFGFSSANSINIGRLVPQVAYYVWTYMQMVAQGAIALGEKANFCVPTGNFGNILAAYYAGKMGLPVGKLICASNDNKVLFDFFKTGTYDKRREFILTTSPSMDILISSNLERLIFEAVGSDGAASNALMTALTKEGFYSLTEDQRKVMSDFESGFADMDDCAAAIGSVYKDYGYVMDTHTAVASSVYYKYAEESGDKTPTAVISTASPYKFYTAVLKACDAYKEGASDEEQIAALNSISGVAVPQAVKAALTNPVRHDHVVEIAGMEGKVKAFLNID